MKKNISFISNITKFILTAITSLFMCSGASNAQDDGKNPLIVSLSYYTVNNSMQYLTVTAKSKVDGRFQPIPGAEIMLYLDKDSTGKAMGVIGKVVTDEKGRASAIFPASLQKIWNAALSHTIIATTDKNSKFDATNTELNIAKAKLAIDTAADKAVVASFLEFKNNAWVPVKGVDIKLGIRRMGGDLPLTDKDAYTTDSTGKISDTYAKNKLPGNKDGNVVLVAKIVDNDTYGNMSIEMPVPWGEKFVPNNDFFSHQALWGSRFHSPWWLVFLAYSIVLGVWGTLVYLVFLILKIKKLGKQEEALK